MTDDREMPLVPTTNRSFAFRVVEMNLPTKSGGGRHTVLRFSPTGGGGAPTVNDHARLDAACEAEAGRIGASLRLLGGGQMCFRGGEISESAEIDDEDEASLLIVLRNGRRRQRRRGGAAGGPRARQGAGASGVSHARHTHTRSVRGWRGRNDGAGIGA